MASMAAVPRVSTGQRRFPNLPVIPHPMSRMSDRENLAVLGSASGLRSGKMSFQDPRLGAKDSAPTSAIRASAPDRILQWPPGNGLRRLTGGRGSDREGGLQIFPGKLYQTLLFPGSSPECIFKIEHVTLSFQLTADHLRFIKHVVL